MEKWYEIFDDNAFTYYNETGEAAAVYIVRDLAGNVNTQDKWIDVLSMNTFTHRNSGRLGFNWIIVELFPRITHPDYKSCNTDAEKKYICWQAAHDDIDKHRSKNHHGEKYIVICTLVKDKEYSWYNYKVLDSCAINEKTIKSIKSNTDNIITQIKKNHKPTLKMFGIYSRST